MPFLRAGYADDGGSLLELSVSTGIAWQPNKDDLVGIAANWGRPNASSFGPGLDDQYGLEVFYRAQITENLRLTPSIQLLANPALNPGEDLVAVFGMRGVLSF
jgi:porin